MKRTSTTVTLMAALLLTSAVAAQAATTSTWSIIDGNDVGGSFNDITKVTIADQDPDYYLASLEVASNFSTTSRSNVVFETFFSTKSDVFNSETSSLYTIKKSSITFSDSYSSITGNEFASDAQISGNTLTWKISKADLGMSSFYFGSTSSMNGIMDTTSVAATPIPGAALLLGSGLLGLVGIKRRKQQLAA